MPNAKNIHIDPDEKVDKGMEEFYQKIIHQLIEKDKINSIRRKQIYSVTLSDNDGNETTYNVTFAKNIKIVDPHSQDAEDQALLYNIIKKSVLFHPHIKADSIYRFSEKHNSEFDHVIFTTDLYRYKRRKKLPNPNLDRREKYNYFTRATKAIAGTTNALFYPATKLKPILDDEKKKINLVPKGVKVVRYAEATIPQKKHLRDIPHSRLKKPSVGYPKNNPAPSLQYIYETSTLQNLAKGKTLESLIKNTNDPLAYDEQIDIAINAAESLQEYHDLGIIHRDFKPANFIVDRETLTGQLIDTEDSTMTTSKQDDFEGTKNYVAPELFYFHESNVKNDAYALGRTIQEMQGKYIERPPGDLLAFDKSFEVKNEPLLSIAHQLTLTSSNKKPETNKELEIDKRYSLTQALTDLKYEKLTPRYLNSIAETFKKRSEGKPKETNLLELSYIYARLDATTYDEFKRIVSGKCSFISSSDLNFIQTAHEIINQHHEDLTFKTNEVDSLKTKLQSIFNEICSKFPNLCVNNSLPPPLFNSFIRALNIKCLADCQNISDVNNKIDKIVHKFNAANDSFKLPDAQSVSNELITKYAALKPNTEQIWTLDQMATRSMLIQSQGTAIIKQIDSQIKMTDAKLILDNALRGIKNYKDRPRGCISFDEKGMARAEVYRELINSAKTEVEKLIVISALLKERNGSRLKTAVKSAIGHNAELKLDRLLNKSMDSQPLHVRAMAGIAKYMQQTQGAGFFTALVDSTEKNQMRAINYLRLLASTDKPEMKQRILLALLANTENDNHLRKLVAKKMGYASVDDAYDQLKAQTFPESHEIPSNRDLRHMYDAINDAVVGEFEHQMPMLKLV